jgi:serine/threonine-protein kinase HipA
MAKKAGITVPQFYLFNARASAGYFGSKRFDYQNGIKRHVLSIGSLMNKNYLFERIYLGYYTDIVRKIAPEEIEKLLRLLMFDLKTGNEDIRGGGISMILTEENKWVLAPAYDLVPFSLENDYTPKMLKKDYEKDAVDALIYDLCEAAEFDFDTAAKMIEQVEDAVAEYSRLSLEFK